MEDSEPMFPEEATEGSEPIFPGYCDAKSRSDNYRITHKDVPGGRILVCAKCSATFEWWRHQDHLPPHVANKVFMNKEQIIAHWAGTKETK